MATYQLLAEPPIYTPCLAGHARVYVAFDVLYRMLSLALGYDVQYVRNFTDIDDKIIARAAASGENPLDLATNFIHEFHKVGAAAAHFRKWVDAPRPRHKYHP